MFKKIILLALVLAIGLAVLPFSGASAEENTPPTSGQPVSNERLEQAWARLQTAYTTQSERLDKSAALIEKIETRIAQANAKGWDTSAVQAALDAFVAALPNASAAHEAGAELIASHAGFDADGKVTDRATAIETAKALGQVVKNTRAAMNGTGEALRAAIQAFLEANGISKTVTP
ncbi:MAG: hypothetical protein HGA79_01840 [Anaerolineales bacterium]|nr:hypothetical protein [Anaerolineales bacterium]